MLSSFRLAKYNFYGDQANFYFKNIQPNIFDINKFLLDKADQNYINKFNIFCNMSEKKCSMYDKNFKPFFYDTKHLTVEGLKKFGKYLKDKI